jgi:Subtilase family
LQNCFVLKSNSSKAVKLAFGPKIIPPSSNWSLTQKARHVFCYFSSNTNLKSSTMPPFIFNVCRILVIAWLAAALPEGLAQQAVPFLRSDSDSSVVLSPVTAQSTALATWAQQLPKQNLEQLQRQARRKGWAMTQRRSDGRQLALQNIDSQGIAHYWITHGHVQTPTTNPLPTAQVLRVNALRGGVLRVNLSGSDVRVRDRLAVWDGGAAFPQHVEFGARLLVADPSASVSDHATHVAGIMAAAGVNPEAQGMAFGANLKSFDFFNDLAEMSQEAEKLLVSNHSYGILAGWILNPDRPGNDPELKWEWWGDPTINATEDYRFGFYDSRTRDLDKLAYLAPNYLIVKSADNKRDENGPAAGKPYFLRNTNQTSTLPRSKNDGYGTIPTDGNAKNIMTVGAVEGLNAMPQKAADIVMSPYSSWGPTDDGRIKPDLVAVGERILGPVSVGPNAYARYSGTSVAAPSVAGALLLLQEYFSRKNFGFVMRASSLKALAIHTAEETGPSQGPDYQFGWGLLNVERAAQVIDNADFSHLIQERPLTTGSNSVLRVTARGGQPLRVTMAWADPEGNPSEVSRAGHNDPTPKLINDLDVRISDGTTSFRPWVLDPANPNRAATNGDNIRDNVEQILIPNPVANRSYTITVSHKGNLRTGSQYFSLIVSGINRTSCQLTSTINAEQNEAVFCRGGAIRLFANSGTDFRYEWFWNNQAIPGANTSSYAAAAAGNYTVRVSQGGCTATSPALRVTESTLRAVAQASGNTNLCQGGRVELMANSGTNLRYQWQKDGQNIPNATRSSWTALEKGRYAVVVTERQCSLRSSDLLVTASGPVPSGSISPGTATTVCDNRPLRLTAASGTGLSYQWFRDTQAIAQARGASYEARQNGTYHVRVSNGTCFSNSVSVGVTFQNLQLSIRPAQSLINLVRGQSTRLIAVTPALASFQWFRNGQPINSATASSLLVSQEGRYAVRGINQSCNVMSEAVEVVVSDNRTSDLVDMIFEDLSVYPNPVEDQAVLRFLPDSLLDVQPIYEVFQLNGTKLNEGIMEFLPDLSYEVQLPIQAWPSGLYLARIVTRNRIYIKKFSKK